MKPVMTGERILPDECRSEAEYILYLRHLFAYRTAASRLRASDTVLDIGCGAGYGTRLLADHAARAVGVDVIPEAVAGAAAAFGTPQCTFLDYAGGRLPFEDGTFDAATSFQTIEHVLDDERFVAEAARVLKPGATLILTTPNRATRLREGQKPWNRFHEREYSVERTSKRCSPVISLPSRCSAYAQAPLSKMSSGRASVSRSASRRWIRWGCYGSCPRA